MTHSRDGGMHAALNEHGWKWIPNFLRFRGGGGFRLAKKGEDVTIVTHYEK